MDIPPVTLPPTDSFERPLQNDLVAYFKQLEQDTAILIDKAGSEGWTPEQLIEELDRLIAGDRRAPATEARI